LNEEESNNLSRSITRNEILKIIKRSIIMKNPGLVMLTAEFDQIVKEE
jgi:ribosomal protein L19E